MAAYASLVSLMRIIHDLEHHPSPPISLDKEIVDSITQHVAYFQEFLHHYNSPPSVAQDAADPLEIRIAGAAYAAEDAIESHIVDTIQQLRSNNDGPKNANYKKTKSINLCCRRLQKVIKEMNLIKKVVLVKIESEKNKKKKKKKKKKLVVHSRLAMTSALSSIARNETLVGSDAVLLEIMEKLIGGRPDFQVIPIVGMGGIGKTFLATSIYTRPLIKEHFDISAWATISQNYDTGQILGEVLSQSTSNQKEQLSEDVLGLMLHKHLSGRRYLIVMDDMWSIDAWDKIQRFFPNNKNGSRVIVTTRLSQLSSQLNNNYSLHMSFLDEASSWDLFSRTVFGEKSCPPELKKIGEKIVDNCRGLPLSIAVVGGLLKRMDGTRGSWESIRDNLTSVVNMENDEHCLRLLKMSYNHLPVYLKPCFLYMGVFEEDDEIRLSKLVKLWVSEGFLKPRNGEALETTAREFLQDLIDRNLILIGKLGLTGIIKSCKIHDLVRDMCLKEGQKEGFYHVIGQCNPRPPQGMNPQRRVVIPRNTSKKEAHGYLRSMSHARSVIYEHGDFPPCRDLGLLRTLHAYHTHVNFHRFGFVNLRYLAMNIFSRDMPLLWNLHTLIVSCPYEPTLLDDIWKMPQLRHIEFVDIRLRLPDPPIAERDDDVVILENLHTLKGGTNLKCSEGVVKRIPNIKKLELEYVYANVVDDDDEYCVGNIKSLCRLESLTLRVLKVLESKLSFPQSLKKLSLRMEFEFDWEDGMLKNIGDSLPLLEKLKLYYGCFGKGKWETVEGQFPCLKYLELQSCGGLENWTAAEEGSNILPRLEHLHLEYLHHLKEIPCELGNIDTLKIIQLIFCEERAVKCAKEMVDEQIELQGGEEQLSFCVEVLLLEKKKHLLSLGGPKFSVR